MAAGLQFGVQQFAIGLEFKSSSLRRDEGNFFNVGFKFFQKFLRQPDGTRGVMSGRTISQFDLDHWSSSYFQLKEGFERLSENSR